METFEEKRNGVAVTPALQQRIDLQVDPTGRVSSIARLGNLPASMAEELQAAGMLREVLPELPPLPIETGGGWTSPVELAGEKTQIRLKGRGRFLGFAMSEGRTLARFEVKRSGTVSTSQRIGRAEVTLPGELSTRMQSRLDIDKGLIVATEATSSAEFDLASGGSGFTGTVIVSLRSRLELVRDQIKD